MGKCQVCSFVREGEGEKIEILSLSQRVSNCFDTGTVKTISCITSDVVTCSGKVHKR